MLSKIKKGIAEFISAACITVCVLPGFELLGDIVAQFFATAFTALLFILIADKVFKINAETISHSLVFMTVFWLSVALIKQIILHIETGDYTLNWLHLFYYDRPAMLFVVFFVAIIYYAAKLILKSDVQGFIKDYRKFIKISTVCLSIYYFIILFYCFVLTRRFSDVRPEVNLIPFNTIITTFSSGRLDYELLFLFLGNLAIFFPLGVFTSAFSKNRFVVAVIPVFVSVSIEISQYFLGNGYPDVDDIILNVIGFYIGVLIKILLDKLLYCFSKGKLTSIFIF